MSDEKPKWRVDYAKSNRSQCTACNELIDKGTVRIGRLIEVDGSHYPRWEHVGCFNHPQIGLDLSNMENMEELKEEDVKVLKEIVERGGVAVGAENNKKKKKRKKKAVIDLDSDSDDETSTTTTTTTKKKKKKQQKTSYSMVDGKAISTDDPVFKKYNNMQISELKDVLRKNRQLLKGKKAELVAKCVDGEKNGRIPRCPVCVKGKVGYEPEKGVYKCGGYFDSAIKMFIDCSFQSDTIERQKWLDVDDEQEDSEDEKGGGSAKPAVEIEKKVEKDEMKKLEEACIADLRGGAQEVMKFAKSKLQLTLPDDESTARQSVGQALVAAKNDDGSWNILAALKQIAEKFPSKEAVEKNKSSKPQAKVNDNSEIANLLEEMAKLTAEYGDEKKHFEAKAQKKAALNIRLLDYKITSGAALAKPGKTKVPGIGKGTAKIIDEYLETGTIARLEELRGMVR